MLKSTKPISRPDWHHLFGHYPCLHYRELTQNEHKFEFAINAGSWLTMSSDTPVYYGDVEGIFEQIFLNTMWNQE
jgi:hypothetical protein